MRNLKNLEVSEADADESEQALDQLDEEACGLERGSHQCNTGNCHH